MIRFYLIAADTVEPIRGFQLSAGAQPVNAAIEVIERTRALGMSGAEWLDVVDDLIDIVVPGLPAPAAPVMTDAPPPAPPPERSGWEDDGPIPFDQFGDEVTVEERMR